MDDMDARHAEICELAHQGLSLREIGRRVAMHHDKVRAIVDSHGIPRRTRTSLVDPVMRARIAELARAGCSMGDIERTTGAKRETIGRVFDQEEIPRPPATAQTEAATEERVRQLARNGVRPAAAARAVGISAPTAARIIDAAGIPREARAPRLDAETRARIVEQSRATPWAIVAREFGVTDVAVAYWARRAGVPSHPKKAHTHAIRHDAFSGSLDSVAMYFLGLLIADGSVDRRRTRSVVTLAQNGPGRELVTRLREFLGAGHPVRNDVTKDGVPRAALHVSSRQLCDDLERLGMHQAKTWRDDPIDEAAASSWAFWLGLLDGDGCIHFDKHTGSPKIQMLGTHRLMKQYQDHLAAHGIDLGVSKAYTRKRDGRVLLWKVEGAGLTARKIAEFLYASVPEHLPMTAKRERARRALEWTTMFDRRRWQERQCAQCRRAFMPPRPSSTVITCSSACAREHNSRRQRLLTPLGELRLISLYLSGLTLKQTAEALGGLNAVTVLNYLERAGIPRRHRGWTRVEAVPGVMTLRGNCQEVMG